MLPDIGAVAPGLAELEIVDVRRRAVLEGENQLMARAVERAHAAVVLVPDAEVLQFRVGLAAGGEQRVGMAPIHAHEMEGAVRAVPREVGESRSQELRELRLGHFSGGHDEVLVFDPARSANITVDLDVVRRVGENELSLGGGH